MFDAFFEFFTFSQAEQDAIYLSIKIALAAILYSLPFAIITAWLLARKNFPGKALLDGIIHLPLVLPPVVIGYLLQWFGFSFAFSWEGAALASAVVAFPLMVRSIRLALEGIDFKLEQAAQSLGASAMRVFFTITLPLSFPGILSGLILGFARSLGEFGATVTFVSNIPGVTRTIPLAMYSFIETPNAETATARLCVIAIAISLISLIFSEQLARRMQKKLGQNYAEN